MNETQPIPLHVWRRLAAKALVTESTVQRLARGQRVQGKTVDRLVDAAKALGINPEIVERAAVVYVPPLKPWPPVLVTSNES